MAWDGVPVFFKREGPSAMEAQPRISDARRRALVRAKLRKVIERRYVRTEGVRIKSLNRYFGVPKGDDDVRMVYDGTANGLNNCI